MNFLPRRRYFPGVYTIPVCDPFWSSVVLALHCDGTAGTSVFTDSTGLNSPSSPGSAVTLSTTNKKFGTASARFLGTFNDPTGQPAIVVPNSVNFDFAAGDFTIEGWVQIDAPTTPSNTQHALCTKRATTANFAPFNIKFDYISGSTYLVAQVSTTGTSWVTITGTTVISTGTWYHVALVRQGTNLKLFLNGIQEGSTQTVSGALMTNTADVTLGAASVARNYGLWGNLDDWRITRGVARYTGAFTPPDAAFPTTQCSTDPYWGSVSTLLHFNGPDTSTTFTDSSSSPSTWTPLGAGALIRNAQYKFGGTSGRFQGSGNNITTPANAKFEFGSGDFTIEMWVFRVATAAATKGLIGQMNPGGFTPFGMTIDPTERLAIRWSNNGTSGTSQSGSTVLALNTWYHVAMVRSGSTLRGYVDGVEEINMAISGSLFVPTTAVSIGSLYQDGSSAFNGYIDELRITKGQARYTVNFTPPVSEFPNS